MCPQQCVLVYQQQMFPSLCSPRNIMDNNASSPVMLCWRDDFRNDLAVLWLDDKGRILLRRLTENNIYLFDCMAKKQAKTEQNGKKRLEKTNH